MSDNQNISEFLIKEMPCKALLHLYDKEESFSQRLARDIDTTYAHTVKTVNRLEEKGLIQSRKEGRKRISEITEKGEKVAEAVENLFEVVEEVGENR